MPAFFAALLLLGEIDERTLIYGFELHGADQTDFVVCAAVLATGVDDGMDVQS